MWVRIFHVKHPAILQEVHDLFQIRVNPAVNLQSVGYRSVMDSISPVDQIYQMPALLPMYEEIYVINSQSVRILEISAPSVKTLTLGIVNPVSKHVTG